MDCREVQELMHAWEKTGGLEDTILPGLEAHIEGCASCRKRYSVLLPFLFRDGDGESGLTSALDDTVPNLEEVKKKLIKIKGKRRSVPLIIGVLVMGIAALSVLLTVFVLQPGLGEHAVKIEFTLFAPEAHSVELMGDFTEWEKNKITMMGPDASGIWHTDVKLEKGKVYKYNFIIDGKQSIADPNSPYEVDDGFGGVSSILQL
jgi:hypothetical protein